MRELLAVDDGIDLGGDIAKEVDIVCLAVDGEEQTLILLQFVGDVRHTAVHIIAVVALPMLQVQPGLGVDDAQGCLLPERAVEIGRAHV